MLGKFSTMEFFKISSSLTLASAIFRCVISRITSTVPFRAAAPLIREREKSNQLPALST